MSFYFILFDLIWFIFFLLFLYLNFLFIFICIFYLGFILFYFFFYHYYFILNIYGLVFLSFISRYFLNVLHLFPSSCLNFVNHFFTFFNNFLLHSFLNNILILSIADKYYLVFYRPTSFSFTLNVYILSIVYLYLQLWCPFEEGDLNIICQLWCPFEEGDLNIICFVLNTDLFYGFCFYFIYCTTLALCLWSSSIKSMFLNTFKLFPHIHFEFETRCRLTPPCLKAKEVYNVKKQTNKQTKKKKP